MPFGNVGVFGLVCFVFGMLVSIVGQKIINRLTARLPVADPGYLAWLSLNLAAQRKAKQRADEKEELDDSQGEPHFTDRE